MLPIRTILYATDFSDRSAPALEVATALARDYAAELVIVHVTPPPVQAVSDGVMIDLPTGWVEASKARLEAVVVADPSVRLSRRHSVGDAAEEILQVADDTEADLIVMGTHGRTGLSRFFVGSVAESVMRRAECPVLTVRVPFSDQPAAEAAIVTARQLFPE